MKHCVRTGRKTLFASVIFLVVATRTAQAGIEVGACCVDTVCQDNSGVGIDRDTCELTLGGVFQGDGSSCQPDTCTVIPAAGDWGLLVLALLVLTAGTLIFTRRREGFANLRQ